MSGARERWKRERGEEKSGRKCDSVLPYRVLYMFSLFLSSFLVSNLALLTTVMMNERMISLQSTFILTPSPASTLSLSLKQKTPLRASSDQIDFPNPSVLPRFQE